MSESASYRYDTWSGKHAGGPGVLVSVVIPVRDRAVVLRDAIRSVVEDQTGPYEIIVVDDGSDDDVLTAVSSFEAPVRVVRLDVPRGAPAARNTGIEAATGDLVAFLDSDDELPVGYFAAVRAAHEQWGSEAGGFVAGVAQAADGTEEVVEPPGMVDRCLLLRFRQSIPTSSIVVSTSVAGRHRFDERLSAYQDWDILVRMAREARLVGLPGVYVRYRTIPGLARITDSSRHLEALTYLYEKHDIAAAEDEVRRIWHIKLARVAVACRELTAARRHAGAAARLDQRWSRSLPLRVASRLPRPLFRAVWGAYTRAGARAEVAES